MAVVTVYQHGIKAGVPPEKSDHTRAKRKAVAGWTSKSARSNVDFLRSVTIEDLDGLGHCVTLTVKVCPPSARIWDEMRDAWIKRLKRAGMKRLHWVTEWQARGVPHLHGVVYFEEPETDHQYTLQHSLLIDAWLEISERYQSDDFSQHVVPIEKVLGWIQYLAKHASRGADHYQRQSECMPQEWQGLSGRLWGKSGEWPTREGIRLEVGQRGYWELRRVVCRYLVAEARASRQWGRVSFLRSRLKRLPRILAESAGFSEWMPEVEQLRVLHWLALQGHGVLG